MSLLGIIHVFVIDWHCAADELLDIGMIHKFYIISYLNVHFVQSVLLVWPLPSLSLILSLCGFTWPCVVNISITVILYESCLQNVESHVHFTDWGAPWKVTSCLENFILLTLQWALMLVVVVVYPVYHRTINVGYATKITVLYLGYIKYQF